MERDDESGFIYIGARYYCPWLARWLAPDPINNEWYNLTHGNPGRNTERQFVELTASSYEYCYANPVRFTDPSGEQVPQKKIEYTKGATATTTTHANPTPANQSQSGNKATSPEFEKSAYFMLGAANAYITNLMFGLLRSSPESISGPYRIDFARGQLAGDMTSMATGHTMTTGGLAGGVITSETGVGALAGAGIAAWGEGVSASGAIHAAITTSYILNYSGNDVGSSSGSDSGNISGGNGNESNANNSSVSSKTKLDNLVSTEVDAQGQGGVENYAEQINFISEKAGKPVWPFSPLDVVQVGEKYVIQDGHHRFEAAKQVGFDGDIPINIIPVESSGHPISYWQGFIK